MTPEKKVKNAVVEILKTYGPAVYHFFPATGGYGKGGVPDIIVCANGHFVAIECKAGKGKTTALQDKALAQISAAGGYAMVIGEHNIETVRTVVTALVFSF